MSPDKLAEVRSWLTKARLEFRGAEIDLAASPPLSGDALFHCQQAAEKALKGFLTFHDRPFRKTHDLDELASECERLDGSVVGVLDRARDLTPFAWRFRYPGDDEPPPAADIGEELVVAREVVRAVVERLPREIS
jgi:HEPN domain-containing protein